MPAEKNPNKSKIPYLFFIFFAVVFAVNILFIVISQKTWRGVAVEDAYRKGLNYNETIKKVGEQKNLGWKMEISFNSSGNKSGIVKVNLEDRNSHQISDAKIYVIFKRPTQEGFDFSKNLEFKEGFYQSNIDFPLNGQWEFEIVAKRDSDIFQEVKRYVIQ